MLIALVCSMLLWQPCQAEASSAYTVGQFVVSVDGTDISVRNAEQKVVWETVPSIPFLRIGNATMSQAPILDGNFQIEQVTSSQSSTVTLGLCPAAEHDTAGTDTDTAPKTKTKTKMNTKDVNNNKNADADADDLLQLCGSLLDTQGGERGTYSLDFFPSPLSTNQLSFTVTATRNPDDTQASGNNDRLFFTYSCDPDESFHGFGESFTGFNLRNKVVPILVSEQGVGRGLEPITDYLNTNVAQGAGGDWYTTYAPKPMYLTNHNHSLVFMNPEVMYFDLTAADSVEVQLWGLSLVGNILSVQAEGGMAGLVSEMTLITGRMQTPPVWTQKGAVVGLEGGTANVTAIVSTMRAAGVPLAGIWLQDWVGLRHSWDGDRLIWNWEVNYDWYPGWKDMVDGWAADDTRVLTYINPFFSDPSNFTTQSRHNFYQEGIANGYFVKKADGSPYTMYSLSIEFCMLDMTNPAAVVWMKQIITDQSIIEAQASGWMADFGEYLPFDAVLFSGEDPASYHNKYPAEWGKLTQEALQESGMENEIMYFMRSAWIQSPQYNSMFWLGDQLVSWDEYDGLKNVVLGALSSALCGHTITHSDIGGYTVEQLGPNMTYIRSEELLKRWTELSTFGAGLFRTHIGSSTTPLDAQVYDNAESMAHFAQFGNIFGELSSYRDGLIEEAQSDGQPLIRPMAMKYAYDDTCWSLEEQYLFGYDFLVAPCMTENATAVSVYIPPLSGPWVHLWSENVVYSNAEAGKWITVPAGIGFPPVLYLQTSAAGASLQTYVQEKEYDSGYTWVYSDSDTPAADDTGDNDDDGGIGMYWIVIFGLVGVVVVGGVVVGVMKVLRDRSDPTEAAHEPFLDIDEDQRDSFLISA